MGQGFSLHADQRWVPYAGAGVKAGGFVVGRALLGALAGGQHPSPWFALDVSVVYGYLRLFGAVHVFRETVGARLTL